MGSTKGFDLHPVLFYLNLHPGLDNEIIHSIIKTELKYILHSYLLKRLSFYIGNSGLMWVGRSV